jgi:uncharacterized protein (TIGR00375 family)
MNLRLRELHGKTIMSFSDSHSYWPWRLGREATIFHSANSYAEIIDAIKHNTIIGTIEANPAYGKYHFNGHRNCNFSCSAEEAKKLKNICPVCHKALVLGVEHRVDELANFKENEIKDTKKTFEVLPLHEVLSAVLGASVSSKRIWTEYDKLIEKFGNEFNILLSVSLEELKKVVDEKIAKMIILNRENKIKVKPGYDGVYGEMVLSDDEVLKRKVVRVNKASSDKTKAERIQENMQKTLF